MNTSIYDAYEQRQEHFAACWQAMEEAARVVRQPSKGPDHKQQEAKPPSLSDIFYADHAHERFVRYALGYGTLARDFLSKYLPFTVCALLDWETLEPVKSDRVDGRLHETHLDCVWRVGVKDRARTACIGLNYLCAGQASLPFTCLHRLLDVAQAHGKKQQPLVYGVLLYNGRFRHRSICDEWTAHPTEQKLQEASALHMQRLVWVDVHTHARHEKEPVMLQAFEECLRFPYTDSSPKLWRHVQPVLNTLLHSPHGYEVVFAKACLRYILRIRPSQDIEPVVRAFLKTAAV